MRRRSLLALSAAFCTSLALFGQPAKAADYPARPVTLIVPFAPGGSTDALARIVAEGMSRQLGQNMVVENKPGAGGNIAMGTLAKADPDGYTLILVSSSLVINPSLYAEVPYDPIKDFAPISYVASAPSVWVANPKLGVTDAKDMLKLIKDGTVTFYASPGIGTAQNLAGELFNISAGVKLEHVPFSGAGPAVAAVVAGDVSNGFSSLPSVRAQIDSKSLVPLAITTKQRSAVLPDVPTFQEIGFKDFEVDHLQGLLAPAGTPDDVIETLYSALTKVLAEPTTQKHLEDLGFVTVGSTPEEFKKQISSQVTKWHNVITTAGISVK